jgi:hypothetical protein
MAAFGTKKPGGAFGAQLTFPSVFSEVYKAEGRGAQFAQKDIISGKQEFVGDDFQAQYQRSKRQEAHKMVRAGVQATRDGRHRSFTSHAGYYNLPEPVLSQRIRGSNFGVGGGGSLGYYDSMEGGGTKTVRTTSVTKTTTTNLTGGVLGSREGRAFAMNRLQARKAQLDAIDASEIEGPNIQAQVDEGAAPDFSEIARIELASFLEQLRDQAAAGKTEFSPDVFRRFVTLFIRFMTVCTTQEYDDVFDRIEDVIQILQARMGGRNNDDEPEPGAAYEATLLRFMGRLYKYTKLMAAGLTKQTKDRRTLSMSALKSSGLGGFNVDETAVTVDDGIGEDRSDRRARFAQGTRFFGEDGGDGPGGGPGGPGFGPLLPGRARGTGARAGNYFDEPGTSAEVTGGPAGGADFTASVREAFGRQGQSGEARAARAFYGEGEEGVGEEDLTADVAEAAAAAMGGTTRAAAAAALDDDGEVYARLRDEAAAAGEAEAGEPGGGAAADSAARTAAGLARTEYLRSVVTTGPIPWEKLASVPRGSLPPMDPARITFYKATFPDMATAEAKLSERGGKLNDAKTMRTLANNIRRDAQPNSKVRLLTTDDKYSLRKTLLSEIRQLFYRR